MTTPLKLISSMATKQVLANIVARYAAQSPQTVALESVGGVDAARRVAAGEVVDGVVLASNAIDKLMKDGALLAGSRVDVVRSGVAIAVRAGAVQPAIATEDDVRRAVLAAHSVSFSTGPSGVYLTELFARWGIAQEIAPKLVQAPPGVPVGSLVASGQVGLGFQQFSELISLPGIAVLGPLPPEIQTITTFSAAISVHCAQVAAAQALLAFMASPQLASLKLGCGMEPAL
jgi:molybdate transport system substrate-binding protein